MIRVSAVSFTNSIPFVYGLTQSDIKQEIDLTLDIPSQCADKLILGQADIGLVPVAILPQIPNGKIISNYCIGAIGRVDTVMLYSQVPLEKIKRIWLDFQSRTSVQLVQVLCREYWNIAPEFMVAQPGYEEAIQDEDAGVIIGDRCFAKAGKFKFSYDLPEHWFQFTGLPFVFAVWLSNKPLKDDFVAKFNQALQFGLRNKELAMDKFLSFDLSREIASTYLNHRISYAFDASKQQGLQLFLSKIK